MAALTEAGVDFEVVPGITAAFAAAAAIPCSLTDRNSASNVTFSTGHHAQSHNESQLPQQEDATRVVYMPGRDLRLLAAEWLADGLPPDFPCAVVSHAAQPRAGGLSHHPRRTRRLPARGGSQPAPRRLGRTGRGFRASPGAGSDRSHSLNAGGALRDGRVGARACPAFILRCLQHAGARAGRTALRTGARFG